MRIAVDWDGTCVPDAWPEQPRVWLPGVKRTLVRLERLGHWLCIFTVRVAPYDHPFSTEGHEFDRLRDPEIVAGEIAYIEQMLASIHVKAEVWTRPYKPPVDYFLDDRTPGWRDLPYAVKTIMRGRRA